MNVERNAWGPDGREVPFAEVDTARRAMFEPMRALAEEYATLMDDKARYLAIPHSWRLLKGSGDTPRLLNHDK